MVDSEYCTDNYKSSKISIGAIIKNPEMLRLVSDHLKIKKLKNKKIKYQKMCHNAVDNYAHALRSVPDCYKTQKMCNKTVCTYPFAIQIVPNRFKSQ